MTRRRRGGLGRRRKRKQSEVTKRKISRSLKGKTRGGSRQGKKVYGSSETRLAKAERVSKIVRNLALSAESPSKIARNASITAKNVSSITRGVDRGLKRTGRATRSIDNLTRSINRFR